MADLVTAPRPTVVESRAGDVAVWEATHLQVRDLEVSLGFWRDLLGLVVREDRGESVALGVDDAELIVLRAGAARPSPRGHTGLYHVALHLPSARAFAEALGRLLSRGVDPRPTDHLMHWAMYLDDPDGIGLELSFETADRFAHVIPGARMRGLGTDGQEHGLVEALDIRPILAAFPDLEGDAPMAAGTRVGHNHLHVADLADAAWFYEQLGFRANAPIAGMIDFHAQGAFPHRLAVNEWHGAGASPAPSDAAGLSHLGLRYADPSVLATVMEELTGSGHQVDRAVDGPFPGAMVRDPSGNRIALSLGAGPIPGADEGRSG